MIDSLQCAWRELIRRKARSLVGVLGYALAVGIVVVLVNSLLVSRDAANAILKSTGTHFIAFVPTTPQVCADCATKPALDASEGFVINGLASNLIRPELLDKVRKEPSVKQAAPLLMFRLRDGADLLNVAGIDPANSDAVGNTCCAPSDILAGSFLKPSDRGMVMIEEAFAKARNLKPQDKLILAGQTLAVLGVVNPGIRPAKADIYMNLADARALIQSRLSGPLGEEFNGILVETAGSTRQEQAMRAIKAILPPAVVSTYACYRPAAQVMGMNENAVWLLAAVVFLGAGAFALKSQWAAVLERRREIGILKAIGWSDRDVIDQIVCEAVTLAIGGGVLGCALGALAAVLPAMGGASSRLMDVLMGAFVLALWCGIIAGAVPAALAAGQKPADALRRI